MAGVQTLLSIRELTEEKRLTNVESVGKYVVPIQRLWTNREFTAERSPTSVPSVGKPSP